MFFDKKNNVSLEKMQMRNEKLFEKMNQEIEITNIIVQQNVGADSKKQIPDHIGHGEKDIKNPHSNIKTSLLRLIDHINLLATIADTYHEKSHFQLNSPNTFIKGDKNKIVRLISHEFALYPADKPLTMEAFNELITEIEAIAKTKHENLQLVLATIPIMDNEKQTYNVVINIECGPEPKIHYFAKRFISGLDLQYDETVNIGYQRIESDKAALEKIYSQLTELKKQENEGKKIDKKLFVELEQKAKNLAEPLKERVSQPVGILLSDHKEHPNITYGGITESETAGGAKYISAINICLDAIGGKDTLEKEATKTLQCYIDNKDKNSLLPTQFSQIVVSNPLKSYGLDKIGVTLTHVDPSVPVLYPQKIDSPIVEKITTSTEQIKNEYPEMDINYDEFETEFTIESPPFGENIRLKIQKPETLEKFSGHFKNQIDEHNEALLPPKPPNIIEITFS